MAVACQALRKTAIYRQKNLIDSRVWRHGGAAFGGVARARTNVNGSSVIVSPRRVVSLSRDLCRVASARPETRRPARPRGHDWVGQRIWPVHLRLLVPPGSVGPYVMPEAWSRRVWGFGFGCSALLASSFGTYTSTAAAEPRAHDTSVQRSCVDVAIVEVKPARIEWAYWLSGGALLGAFGRSASPMVGLGTELTRQAFVYRGFPAGGPGWLSLSELRWGPWFAASTRDEGGLVEAGVDLKWTGIHAPTWGTWDLRGGAGYGAFEQGRAAFASATFLWGARSVRARYHQRGYCDPPAMAATVGEGSGWRVFVTYRSGFSRSADREVVVGIELSPSMLLPPWSCNRWTGNRP